MTFAAIRAEAAALALFAVLAAFHTWPLASAPATWCRDDNGDTLLNEWTIAWVAHQLPRNPLGLFDANIFYPERRTLAFSEHLFPQALMASPLLWAGASPVVAFNVVLLAGFVLTAWAMCHVVRRWTGSGAAGLIAGSLAAFNAHTLTRLGHLQAQHLEFLPLALLALDRLLSTERARHVFALAAWLALQALTSFYFAAFTAAAMVVSVAVRAAEWVGPRFRRVAPQLLLAAVTATVGMLPFAAAYWQVQRDHAIVRTLGEVSRFSAIFGDYLATGSLVHWRWSGAFWRGDGLFPGVAALALTAIAVASGVAFKDRRARMWLAIAIVSVCLSFGAAFPPYVWLFRTLPVVQGIRAPIRVGQFALVAVAALAGFGAAWWLARLRAGWRRVALAAVLLVLVNAEAWRGPLAYVRFEGIPRVFHALASAPHAVVVCFPFPGPDQIDRNAEFMLASTLNWRPMLNGYSGFVPGSYTRHLEALSQFPDDTSLRYLRQLGVTHVVIDAETFSGPREQAIDRVEALRLWVTDGRYRIYDLR